MKKETLHQIHILFSILVLLIAVIYGSFLWLVGEQNWGLVFLLLGAIYGGVAEIELTLREKQKE